MLDALRWRNTSAASRYAAPVVAVGTAVILAGFLERHWQSNPVVSLLLLAIMFSVRFGGMRPGLLAVMLSILAFDYFFLAPAHSLLPASSEMPRFSFFAVCAVLLWLLAAAHIRAADSLRQTRDGLAETVKALRKANQELQTENANRTQAEVALQRSEKYLAAAQRLSRTGSFGWSPSADSIIWSEETFQIFEYDRTTTPTADRVLERTHPDDVAFVRERIRRASLDGKNLDLEHRLLMPDGRVKYLHVIGRASQNSSGSLEFVGAVMDVTEQHHARAALAEQASLLDLSHDTVLARDMNDVITYWNHGAEERYGWTAQEAVGKVTHQLLQTIFPVPLEEINAELLQAGRWEGELIHARRDGTPLVVASRWALQRDQARKPTTILETNNDITEHRRWRSMTEALPQLVWAATPDGACDYFSAQWTEYTGVPEGGLLGWRWMEVLHPDDREPTRRVWADSVAGRRTYDVEYRVRRHDGAYGWFKTRGTAIRDSAGRIIKWFGTCTDITESETRYRNIFQTVGVSIWEDDFSQVKAAIDALKHRGIQDLRQYLRANPQFVRQAISMAKVVDVNDVTPKLFAAENKADLMASLHKVFLPETQETFAEMLIAIAEGRSSFEAETVLQTLKGERLTALLTMTFPPPPAGFESVLVSVTDITERRAAEAERERLGLRLRQAEKMEAIGRLAGGIAHDFNNVLGGILAYGEMLDDEAPEGSSRKRYVQNVLTAASRGRALVDQILSYSRSQRGRHAPVDIVGVVAEALELVRGSLPADIRLESRAPALPLTVIGDATRLHQVAMNLCSNAIQALRGGGTLRVQLEVTEFATGRTFSHGTLESGRYAALSVDDNGSGMDEATLSRIFEPFFTTKEIGQGTGLGLSLVYAIVTDLAGAIDVKSSLGVGSTFAIYLPLVAAVSAPRVAAA